MADSNAVDASSKPYTCDEPGCGKQFARPSKLNAHKLTHSSERPHVCTVQGCGKAYHRSQHLVRHIQQAHSPEKQPTAKQFTCEYENCGQSFALKQSLKKHISRNHEEMPYRCCEPGCNQSFRKKHQLKAHSFEHKGVLPFQCDYEDCDKRFSQSSHLIRHRKQHQGYSCTEDGCPEHFEKWSLLRKHVATDHKKMYKCKLCPKKYPSKYFLKEHESSHCETTEMFQCPIEGCPRRYSALRNLNAHVKSYHGNKQFSCPVDSCSRSFSTKQKMLLHQKMHDPKKSVKMKKAKRKSKSAVSFLVKAICGNQIQQSNSSKPDIASQIKTKEQNEINTDDSKETIKDMDISKRAVSDTDSSSADVILIDSSDSDCSTSDDDNNCDSRGNIHETSDETKYAFTNITSFPGGSFQGNISKVSSCSDLTIMDNDTDDIVTITPITITPKAPELSSSESHAKEIDKSDKEKLLGIPDSQTSEKLDESYEVLLQTEGAVFKLIKDNSLNGRKNM